MGDFPFGATPALQLQAATPYPGGFALQNATPTFLTWTAPNDGQLHRVQFYATVIVTVAETGGAIQIHYTDLGGTLRTHTLFAGGAGPGEQLPSFAGTTFLLSPGDTIQIFQSSALSAGAAVCYAEFWGS